jgi:mannose-6-phosphate isomerase
MINIPLKFKPILKEKIWGGTKLANLLNKQTLSNNVGESWEIADVDNDVSIVLDGKYQGVTLTTLINKYKSSFVGKKVYQSFGNKFPLLIKFIDAKDDLSIQLHPNDEYAIKNEESFGKSEMWYIMQADDDAQLIIGFKEQVNSKTYQKHLKEKTLLKILNSEYVKEGDVYFIPPGRVHAIRSGVLLAEIQQASDITYRIYDWNRKDKNGIGRELHTKKALEVIDFEVKDYYKKKYQIKENQASLMIECPFFTTNIIEVEGKINVNHFNKDSFVIYLCVSGNVIFANNDFEIKLNYGETLLIPNSLNKFEIISNNKSKLLEVFIE